MSKIPYYRSVSQAIYIKQTVNSYGAEIYKK